MTNPTAKSGALAIGERPAYINPDVSDASAVVHHIHFLEDGFTALGKVWYRGQELVVQEGTPDWDRIADPVTGKSWITLTEEEQIDRYGRWVFREGPWRGKGFDLNDPVLTEEEKLKLQRIQESQDSSGIPVAVKAKRTRGPAKGSRPPVSTD